MNNPHSSLLDKASNFSPFRTIGHHILGVCAHYLGVGGNTCISNPLSANIQEVLILQEKGKQLNFAS